MCNILECWNQEYVQMKYVKYVFIVLSSFSHSHQASLNNIYIFIKYYSHFSYHFIY